MPRFLALLLLLLVAGCHKQESQAVNKPIALAGADKVLESLAKKDYDAVVNGMVDIKTALTPEKQRDYARLRETVLGTLISEMGDNDQAKQAYRAIGMLETGR
jgi:hypothetical protein